MESCIFCKIVKGKIPATKIYEDKNVLAFLDISPINPGHALVVPKKHFETLIDIDDSALCETMKIVKKLSKIIMKAVNADGINIGINNYKAAGQLVPHLHVHIMPRFANDGHRHWSGKQYQEGEMQKIADKIRKAL